MQGDKVVTDNDVVDLTLDNDDNDERDRDVNMYGNKGYVLEEESEEDFDIDGVIPEEDDEDEVGNQYY